MLKIKLIAILLAISLSTTDLHCHEACSNAARQNLRTIYDHSNLLDNFDWKYYASINGLNVSNFNEALEHYQNHGFFKKLPYCQSQSIVITLSIENISSLNGYLQKINHFIQINTHNNYHLKICLPIKSVFPGPNLDSSSSRDRYHIIKNLTPYSKELITLRDANNLYRIKKHVENNINIPADRIQFIFSVNPEKSSTFKTTSFLLMLEQIIQQNLAYNFIVKLHDSNTTQERESLTSFINVPVNTLLRTHDFIFSTMQLHNYNKENPALRALLKELNLPQLSFSYSLDGMFIASHQLTNFLKNLNLNTLIEECNKDKTKAESFELLLNYLVEYLNLQGHRVLYKPWLLKTENVIGAPEVTTPIDLESIKHLVKQHTIKMMAIYFPQFHEFAENNKFWGKGFTEWTLMNRFTGEIKKPHIDIGQYDMLDIQTRIKQRKIAQEHGISAFCYYHYWFKDKKVMHAGVEKILEDGEPNLPFLFCWANETWSRTWDGANHKVLILQDYGSHNDWVKHFNYLLPFFKHPNYIKQDNCPLFYVYRLEHISKQNALEMFKLWKKMAKEAGFAGLKVISMLNGHDNLFEGVDSYIDGYVEHQPTYNMKLNGWASLLGNGKQNLLDCHTIYNEIAQNPKIGTDYTRGIFYSWDHSSRRVNNSSFKFVNNSYKEFKELLVNTVKNIAAAPNSDQNYILINSWNEWTEQAMIEPNNYDGYKLLEIIRDVFI